MKVPLARLSTATAASVLDGVPRTLPALLEAHQLTRRAANVGFDWKAVEGLFEKLAEEAAEVRLILRDQGSGAIGSVIIPLAGLFPAETLETGAKLEVLAHTHFRMERIVLRHVADAAADFIRLGKDIEARHANGAGRWAESQRYSCSIAMLLEGKSAIAPTRTCSLYFASMIEVSTAPP